MTATGINGYQLNEEASVLNEIDTQNNGKQWKKRHKFVELTTTMTIKMPTQKDNAQRKGAPNIHTNVPTTNQTNFHLILFFCYVCVWFVRSFSYFAFFYHFSHSSYAYERLFCCSLFFRAQISNHLMVQRVNKRSNNKETIFKLI